MYKIGVTGPIASGKTALTKILSKLKRTAVIDVDQISRTMYSLDSPIYLQVSTAFKEDGILDPTGAINRRILGKIVFASSEKRMILNEICFPYLRECIEKRLSQTNEKLVIIDAGVLLQAKWDSLCDEVWTTMVRDDIAVKRIMVRDGLTKEEAVNRVASQMPVEERLKRCRVVLETNGTVEELEQKVLLELTRLQWIWADSKPGL